MNYVAVKLHHIDQNYSDFQKENYIKHVIRESNTHQKINHPNIVKVIDKVYIDQDTFATVMEYCDGQVL